MPKVAVILANGFEEIEALTVVESCVAQISPAIWSDLVKKVTGSHAIQVQADRVFDGNLSEYDMIVLPGGMPGSAHLMGQ